jgi:TatD DNase family protein
MNVLFDSHVHLNDGQLYPIADTVVSEALEAGVGYLMCIGYDPETNLRALDIASRHANVYCSLGFHPEVAEKVTDADFLVLEQQLQNPKVKAIGECGLDYYWNKDFLVQQKAVFKRQIELANQTGLPIVVHMRESLNDTFELLKEYKNPTVTGVMHCYSGSAQAMKQFLDLNLYISLAGPVTFKNARVPKEVAVVIPSYRLLIETDAPYLSPVPYRGKPNAPKYLVETAKVLAELRGQTLEEIARITTENAKSMYRIAM